MTENAVTTKGDKADRKNGPEEAMDGNRSFFMRRNTIFIGIVVSLFILVIPAFLVERSLKKEVISLKGKYRELTALSNEYKAFSDRIDIIEKRISLVKVNGIVQAIDDLSSSLGIKKKVKSVKVVGRREITDTMTEEMAEVLIEKVDMNELVNIFYKAENMPMALSIKKVKIKKPFDNPELLDVTMTVALFTEK